MPAYIMEGLKNHNGVCLLLTWKDGKQVNIHTGKALTIEANRVSWTLAELLKAYNGSACTTHGKTAAGSTQVNPETGGVSTEDAPASVTQSGSASVSQAAPGGWWSWLLS